MTDRPEDMDAFIAARAGGLRAMKRSLEARRIEDHAATSGSDGATASAGLSSPEASAPCEPDVRLELDEMVKRKEISVVRLSEARRRYKQLREAKSEHPVFPTEPEAA